MVIYLNYGYSVNYPNNRFNGINLGHNNDIIVRVEAENLASCPLKSGYSYLFSTQDYPNSNLSASITGIRNIDLIYSNLGAKIYPLSTAFFYDKIFTVRVEATDYAGNSMEPLEFTFKIESKPQ